jgi:uncharacterized repeat protein (TIGR01451 family)
MLSLIIFALSFGLLFAGPAVALRMMAGPVEVAGPSEGAGSPVPQVHASVAVTDVVLQQGKRPFINNVPVGAVYAGTEDTYMNRWIPTTNYWSESRVVLGQSGAYRPLIRFDLGPALIPGDATIISAELGIYCNARNLFNDMEAQVYQVIKPWNPLEVTWERAAAGDPWIAEGCDHPGSDRFADPADERVVFDRNTFQMFDVTSIVQNWVDTPTSNEGFLLVAPDPAVIYYYRNSRFTEIEQRPKLWITYTIAAPPPPTPTPSPTPTLSPTPGPSPTPTPTATPTLVPGQEIALDETSACYTHTVGAWSTATGGGYNDAFEYENVTTVVTASWRPCIADPLPHDSMYEVFAHWSVHAARPAAVPYDIYYDGGSTTIFVDQTKDADGMVQPDFSPSDWYSLGVYPFRAGTYATTGEYVELSSPPDSTVTCADAVRWVSLVGAPGPPFSIDISANPAELPSDGTSTSTIAVTVTDKYGNKVANGTMVGLTTTLGTLPYAYTEAENAAVTKLGTWNLDLNPGHSGGQVVYSDNFGDEVSWTFWGQAASMVYYTTNLGGTVADVSIDGTYVTTINFASAGPQFRVERQLASNLTPGWHVLRVRNAGGGRIWLDAFRSGASTSGGMATVPLTAPNFPGTATVGAVALGAGLTNPTPSWPYAETFVTFPGPAEVWVDDDYCSVCPNNGHIWNYDAFDNIQDGVSEVIAGGTVYVAPGMYPESVTISKPASLMGAGGSFAILDGVSDTPGSRGFYVDRADDVTITGFGIKNFETGVYLRGTGAGKGPRVQNATVMYNAFQSNDAGSNSYAVRGTFVYTSTICSNDISLGYHGIWLQDTHGTVVCYNDIHENKGFGVKIDTGNDNSIDNNTIHHNQNVGIELTGATLRNGVYGNTLHSLWWDGVLVNGATDAQVAANAISDTNLSWLNASGSAPDANHNLGGVVLVGTTNSMVYDNRIFDVSNAAGNRADAAGVYLKSNTAPILIETNLIRDCVGHGIHVPVGGGNATIHGNSIFGNGRFGLNNQIAVNLQAQGNWWGRNTPTGGPAEPRDIFNKPGLTWSPPIQLSLAAFPTSIPANGVATSTITATATGYGYNILDGTGIDFTNTGNFATLVYPSSNVFASGHANTLLRAGTFAGVETITGTAEPGIEGQSVDVLLTALSPHTISVSADPTSVEVGGGPQGESLVTAVVEDMYGNGVPLVTVNFSSDALGGVSPAASTTVTGTGAATTTFSSGGFTGVATITATTGLTLSASTNIIITAGPPCTGTITAVPAGIPANGVATSTITVALTDCVGYAVPDGTMVGFTTTRGSIVNYKYVEAESPEIITSTGWAVGASGSASGGQYIGTSSTGAAAYWDFRGEAVSLIYQRFSSGGMMRVRVDGGAPVDINTGGTPTAWMERVIATNLNPLVTHQIEITHQSGTIRLDVFRSGAATTGGIATGVLRAPVLAITDTATVYATSALGHPVVPPLVLNTTVVLSQTDIVWVDDNWAGLPNGTGVAVPGGTAYIGNNAFHTIPLGVDAVQPAGTVYVLPGNYPLPVNITKTLNLLGSGSASTFITGSGSGNGVRIRNTADGSSVEGFTVRNFDYGMYFDGRDTNNLDGVICSNNVVTGSVTGAITATFVNNGQFIDNTLNDNPGVGFDLHHGDDNIIRGNSIHDNGRFGLRLRDASGAIVSYNDLYDLQWDGIHVGVNCTNADVFSNTVRATNLSGTPSAFNHGGIVLNSTTNSDVAYNTVTEVDTAGGGTDTAGVYVDGNDGGAMIHHNRILANVNDGILLADFLSGQPPEIHCNHIYGNGRFGLRNTRTTTVDAEDNWWGRNNPTRATTPPKDIYWPAPPNVDWNPRIELTLTSPTPTVTVGTGPIMLTAVGCGSGCCMLDGTPITFTTNLGGLGGPPGPSVLQTMSGGQSTIPFTPGTVAGLATIDATVPSDGLASTVITVQPGLPASIFVSATPDSIPVGNVITSSIAALVLDLYGNTVADGTDIDFDTTLGWTLLPTNTSVGGVATTTLYSGVTPGMAMVTAAWNYIVGSTQVEITAGPPYTITSLIASPTAILANGLDTSQITASVEDQYGNPVPDGTMVGFTTTAGSMIYDYVEAEDPEVITSTAWTEITDGSGTYIRTTTVGAEAYWQFRGQAVSLIYRRFGSGGQMRVRVDGGTPVDIDTSGAPTAWVEQVIATNLNPGVLHEIRATCVTGQIRLDAFRSGAATYGGQAVGILTSAPLPPQTATVWATAIGGTFPVRTVNVDFLQPLEVWVDDDYCPTCFNGGHLWGFDAFSNMPDGVTAVRSGGTVHVLSGAYTLPVTISKPLYLDGAGSATTFVTGSGTGNGIRVTQSADGTNIEGFTIRNFGYGVYFDGRTGNNIDGVTFSNSVITGSVTGAITATFVNDGRFTDNALYDNDGFGFDLHHGDDNIIRNNHVYDNAEFGLRVRDTDRAVVRENNVHDLQWDGIRVGGGSLDTDVFSNTVRATNLSNSPSGFNGGGIVLNSSTNSEVAYNTVTQVGTAGGSNDTAGVYVDGSDAGATIHHNRILNNVNDGILLFNFLPAQPPEIHCNHIYDNGRFGLRNRVATYVDATDNWWGRNTPQLGTTPGTDDIYNWPPTYVNWDPRIRLILSAVPAEVPAGGPPVTVTAIGCGDTCCLLDGTPITFTTDISLGGVGIPPAASAFSSMNGGQASVPFTPGTLAGTATITATVPNRGRATTTITIKAGPPYAMEISASPEMIWPWTCRPAGYPRKSTIGITVTDQYDNPCAGEPVTYTLSPGLDASLEWTTGILDANGYHLTILDAGDMSGIAVVTAMAGTISESVPVEIMPSVPVDMVLDRAPSVIAADGVSTSIITATVRDGCGNFAYDDTMVGFTTTRGSMIHDYVEVEGSQVVKSGVSDWTSLLSGSASGGELLYTDSPGAWVRWEFMGSAVSVVYRRGTGGGEARVFVDGVLVRTLDFSAAATEWQRETVVATGLNPAVAHNIQIECFTDRVWIDALRSGATTVNGVATAILTSERANTTATIYATAIDARIEAIFAPLVRTTTVDFRRADLAVTKNAAVTAVRPDELVDFVINYANNSTLAQATDTLITDTLPSGLSFETSASSPNIGMPTFYGGNQWVYNAGNVQPGASGVITFTARRTCPSTLGWKANSVDISSLTLETALGDNNDADSVNFVLGPPYFVTVEASPQVIEVDMDTTVRITVTDQCEIPVPSATVYITTNLGAFNAAGTQTTETRTTNVNGRANVDFWSRPPISGTATIEATAVNADGSATGVGYVYIGAGPAKQTILTADPTVIPADGLSTSTLKARVLDTGGNPVPDGFLVGFTTTMGSLHYGYVENDHSDVHQSPPGSWVTESSAPASGGNYIRTNADGVSVYWNFRGNGVSILYRQTPTAGIGDVYLDGNPLPFIDMAGPNAWRAERVYTWSGSPTAAHTLRLAHRTGTGRIYMDAFRSGVATSGGQSIALLTSPTITGTATVAATAISETFTVVPVLLPGFADVRFESADVEISKTIEPVAPVSTGQRITFTINYENTGPITATGAYIDDTISDGAVGTGWLRDVFFTTTPLTVTPHMHYYWSLGSLAPGASGSITFGGIVEPNRYWPAETVVTNTVRIGTNTVDPRSGNNTRRVSTTIVPGAPASISLSATPGSIPVGGATSLLRATVRDAYGNVVANGTPVTLTTTLGGFPTLQERVRTTTNGEATQQLTSGPTAGTAEVTAEVDSLSDSVDVIFTPLGPFTVTVTANPNHIKVGGSTSVIEALVVDQYGNAVVNGTGVSFATSAGSVNPTAANTVNGRAVTVLTSGLNAVTAVVTATSGSASGTTTVVFEPGEPSVRISANPMILDVGQTSNITVMAKDQFGNNVADGTLVTYTTSLGYFTTNLMDTILRTTTGGSATTGLTSQTPGTAVVRGEVGGESASVAVTFEPGEPHVIKILSVEPGLIPSCVGTALARAEVRDRFGNLVKNGTVVVFDVIPTGDVEPIDGGRTANGIAQAIISAGTTPTWATVIAWPERYRTSVSDQFGIEFQVGPPDRIDAAAEPPRLTVGGNRATIRARVFDCGGYPVTDGTVVTYTLVSGQGSLSPQTTTTASGWAYSYLTSPDDTGTAQVRVASGDRETTVLVEYIPGPPFDIELSAEPLSIPANGMASTRIDADVSDRYGNAVLDRTMVIFTTDRGRFATTTSINAYTTGGKASAVLTSSTLPGIAQVEAVSVGARSDPAYVDFYTVTAPTPGWSLYLPVIMKNRYR